MFNNFFDDIKRKAESARSTMEGKAAMAKAELDQKAFEAKVRADANLELLKAKLHWERRDQTMYQFCSPVDTDIDHEAIGVSQIVRRV